MKKILLTLIFCYCAAISYAQKPKFKNPISVIKVRSTPLKVTAIGSDTLWVDYNNRIVLRIKGEHKGLKITLQDGRVTEGKNDSVYFLRVNANNGSRKELSVYHVLKGNRLRPCLNKYYTVLKIPDPIAYVGDIKQDSTADPRDLTEKSYVRVNSAFYKKWLPVKSFMMECLQGEQVDSLFTNGNKFSDDMRKCIRRIESGSVIYFDHIKYVLPDGIEKEIPSISVFVNKTNKYRVGY